MDIDNKHTGSNIIGTKMNSEKYNLRPETAPSKGNAACLQRPVYINSRAQLHVELGAGQVLGVNKREALLFPVIFRAPGRGVSVTGVQGLDQTRQVLWVILGATRGYVLKVSSGCYSCAAKITWNDSGKQ